MENETLINEKKKFNVKNLVLLCIQALIILISIIAAIFVILNHSSKVKDPKDFKTNMMIISTDSMEPTLMTGTMIFGDRFESNEVLDIGTVVTYAVKSGDGYITITHRIVGYYYSITDSDGIERSMKIYGEKDVIMNYKNLLFKYQNNPSLKFIGYLTRGDKYTLEFGASFDNYTIHAEDGSINYNKDDYYYSFLTNDQILATWSGRQSKFLGSIVSFLQQPNHLMLCIVLPIILLIIYNVFLVVREIINDKKIKAKEDKLKELKENLDEEEIKKKAIEEYLASLNKKED